MPNNLDSHEWLAFVMKWSSWIISGIVGLVGKVCYELMMKRQLTTLQWIGVGGLSVFVGYLTAVWCMRNSMDTQGLVIVPVATLFGEKIIIFITAKHKDILMAVFNVIVKKK